MKVTKKMRSLFSRALRYAKKHGFQRLLGLLLKTIIGAFRCILPYSISAQFQDREVILIVSHEASRTGAPILTLNIVKRLIGRYNVIVLLLDDGAILDDFRSTGATVILAPRIKEISPLIRLILSFTTSGFITIYAYMLLDLLGNLEYCLRILPLHSTDNP